MLEVAPRRAHLSSMPQTHQRGRETARSSNLCRPLLYLDGVVMFLWTATIPCGMGLKQCRETLVGTILTLIDSPAGASLDALVGGISLDLEVASTWLAFLEVGAGCI